MKLPSQAAQHLTAALAMAALAPSQALTQSVRLDGNGTIGQGIMRPRGISECVIVAPLHVVQGVATIHASVDGGAQMVFTLQQPHEDSDIAILTSRTPVRSRCVPWQVPSNLTDLLEDQSHTAVLRSREEDGGLSFTPVWIRSVTSRHVRVTPRESERLQSGMSGSQLLVNGRFVGMLQRVEPDSGIGLVIRTDVIERVVGGFFTAPRNQEPDLSAPPLGSPSNVVNLWVRTGQSVLLGDRHTSFGITRWYPGSSPQIRVQMNDDAPYMRAGSRLPFRDSRGECHIIYMRSEDTDPNRSGDERHGFAVVCTRKEGQENEDGILRRRP
jgi:hypothetical protein